MNEEEKRLFFGMEVDAPWPSSLPSGRVLNEKERHITLAFLGSTDYSKIKEILPRFPKPNFKVGFVGKFDQCLFFPKKFPRVVAWHPQILEKQDLLIAFQKILIDWLKENALHPDCKHAFTPHVTIARSPFDSDEWRQNFTQIPFILKDIHLYESLGKCHYAPLWTHSIFAPFEPIEHTADLAFLIRGESFSELYRHATAALSFSFPQILDFISSKAHLDSLDGVIGALNELVFQADIKYGCPFKAVSFHTKMQKLDEIYNWEMIVDV